VLLVHRRKNAAGVSPVAKKGRKEAAKFTMEKTKATTLEESQLRCVATIGPADIFLDRGFALSDISFLCRPCADTDTAARSDMDIHIGRRT
jgi:hypothetical protein